MQTINPHNLVEKERKVMPISPDMYSFFCTWRKLFNEVNGKEPTIEDAFVGGYFLGGNQMLREKYKKAK